MNSTRKDEQLLAAIYMKHNISFEKVVRLLQTVREYELTDRRTGIYDAMREIIKAEFPEKASYVNKY